MVIMARRQVATQTNPLPSFIKAKIFLCWMKNATALYRPLSTNVIREVCLFINFHPLVAFAKIDRVVVFSPVEMQVRSIDFQQVELQLQFSIRAACVCIREDHVLICGGMEARRKGPKGTPATFLVNNTRAVRVRDMGTARCFHALYYHEASRAVFAFGGIGRIETSMKKCEQYDLVRDLWEPLPNTQGHKDSGRVCGDKGKVYILGHDEPHCEVFTIATKMFAVLPILLVPIYSCTCLAAWKGQLLVIQEDTVRSWDVNSGTFISETTLTKGITANSALVYGDALFGVNDRVGFSLNLQTMTFGSFISVVDGQIW